MASEQLRRKNNELAFLEEDFSTISEELKRNIDNTKERTRELKRMVKVEQELASERQKKLNAEIQQAKTDMKEGLISLK
jgi:t-SNARE complex subunit (syntaxin)